MKTIFLKKDQEGDLPKENSTKCTHLSISYLLFGWLLNGNCGSKNAERDINWQSYVVMGRVPAHFPEKIKIFSPIDLIKNGVTIRLTLPKNPLKVAALKNGE